MALSDLIEQAADLHSYDSDGVLWIFRRPVNQIDLSLTFVQEYDMFRAEVADGSLNYSALMPTRLGAVTVAMDGYLLARQHGLGTHAFNKARLERRGR